MNNWRKKNKYKDAFKKLSSKLIINKSRNNSNPNSEQVNNDNYQTKPTDKNLGKEPKIKTPITFSDKVNLVGVIVNAFIAGCTLYALYLTNQSLKVSKDSLDFAKKTSKDSDSTSKANFDLTKQSVQAAIKISQFADSNYSVTKKGIETSNENYQNSYKISEKSFNETVSQFNKSNTPYIQITNIKLEDVISNNPIIVNYEMDNLTNIPVKIIKQRGVGKIDTIPFKKNEIENFPFKTIANQYLIKGDFITNKSIVTTGNEINDHIVEAYNKSNNYVYYYREIVYENLINHKLRRYVFELKLKRAQSNTVSNNTYVEFLINENYDK